MKKKEKILIVMYAILTFFVIIQTVSRIHADYITELTINFYISQGLTPYIDFFEFHPLLQNMPLSYLFQLPLSLKSILWLHELLAVMGVLLSTFLVFLLAKKCSLSHPHFASMIFLAGYTGLSFTFTKYEFWSMLFVLIFLVFSNPIIRGIILALLLVTNPMTISGAVLMGCVYLYLLFKREKLKSCSLFFLGVSLGVLIILWLFRDIPALIMYNSIFTFNMNLAHLYSSSWKAVLFFSVPLSIPIIIMGLYASLKISKQDERALLASVFTVVFLLQIVYLNLAYGLFSRIKLPALLPALGVMVIFIAWYRARVVTVVFIYILLVMFVAYTPIISLAKVEFIEQIANLDKCISPQAKVYLEETDGDDRLFIKIFRQPTEYYWFVRTYIRASNISYKDVTFKDPVSICRNTVEKEDIICSDADIQRIQELCKVWDWPESLWYRRNTIRSYVTNI